MSWWTAGWPRLAIFGHLAALFGCTSVRAPLTQVDAGVWRSGQPQTTAEWQTIKDKGITDVIKLSFDGEGTDILADEMGLVVHLLPIEPRGDEDVFDDIANTFRHPDPATLAKIDALLATTATGRVFLVHCLHGQDRTGFVVARHRVLHSGWTKDRAKAEAVRLGFHTSLHGINDAWEDWKP